MTEPVLISACLLGLPTRYDGEGKDSVELNAYLQTHNLLPVPVCPEQLGGLATPRPKAQIVNGVGADVLCGKARVWTECGTDVSEAFVRGAELTRDIANRCGCQLAILKEKSPSCGRNAIYRESKLILGQGVTAALLLDNGLKVLSDEELS